MPIGLLEAMSYGLPCISTFVGGIPEVITDGVDGLLVPVANSKALADAIERLALNQDLRFRMGSAARQKIIRHFNWETRAGEVIELYNEIITQ
jgi:glycosyltransferase involved in cell wall biosynthesis